MSTNWVALILRPGANAFGTAMMAGWIILGTVLSVHLPGVVGWIILAMVLPAIAWYAWIMAEWRRAREAVI
jgi:hypothetical protein